MRQVDILRLDLATGKAQNMADYVAEEVPFQISINSTYSFIIWCSPSQYKELAVGYLLAEEITLNETDHICNVKLKPEINIDERMKFSRRHTRVIPLIKASTSPYQRKEKIRKVESDLKVKAQVLLNCIGDMNTRAKGFQQTGGLHDSAIYKADGTLVAFSEDVGRHNTVDKVIGAAALDRVNFGECIMTITGRVPGDMIFKAAKVGLPMVASMAAVLSSGVSAAEKANIALVGFIRGKRMNIYTCADRIIF
jgi:FdhD protein